MCNVHYLPFASLKNVVTTIFDKSKPAMDETAGHFKRERAIPPPMAPRPITVTFMLAARYCDIIFDMKGMLTMVTQIMLDDAMRLK